MRAVCLLSLLLALLASSCSRATRLEAPAPVESSTTALTAHAAPLALTTPRQLVRTVSMELSVESAERARTELEKSCGALGGFLETFDSTNYQGVLRVSLKLRVPGASLDGFLGTARKLGVVQHESQAVEDVTRKAIDVDARLRNLQRTEQRLLALLESPASSALNDVLAVERELSRVREESEVLTAEQRALKKQVALSTVSLTLLQESRPLPAHSFWAPFQRLYRDAGSILAESFAALLALLAALLSGALYLLPWTPLLAAVGLVARKLLRVRRARRKAREAA